ncbi:MAG: BadF/BadG/BcrA/BcrD ATPase family protein [Thermoguttaceae bacterium]|jgi:N-acetylglucosamine kinase-like BadF-type ATPase
MGPLILGIDAGGSKTVAWLARWDEVAEPEVIGCGEAGPANPQSADFPETLKNLTTAVKTAFAAACIPRQTVASAVLAAAGSDREENRRALSAWAEEISLAVRFQVVHDAWPVLAAGTPDGWGIALISGTGSLVFARASDGRTARAGGWGFLFGDEGSGYALAIAGLRAAAQAADGRAVPTQLLDAILDHFHLDQPEALISTVYPLASNRQRIAELAETVLEVAVAGDATAGEIVHEAARQLAVMVAAVAVRLGWRGEIIPLALAGGVLVGRRLLCGRLQDELRSLGLQTGPVTIVRQPVLGAMKLAREAIPRADEIGTTRTSPKP